MSNLRIGHICFDLCFGGSSSWPAFTHGLWRMLAPWVLEERVGREPSLLMSSGLLTSTWHLHGVASAGWDSTLVLARIEVSPRDFTQCRNSWSAFFQGGLKQSEGTESCLVHSLSFFKWMLFSCWKNRRCALEDRKQDCVDCSVHWPLHPPICS